MDREYPINVIEETLLRAYATQRMAVTSTKVDQSARLIEWGLMEFDPGGALQITQAGLEWCQRHSPTPGTEPVSGAA